MSVCNVYFAICPSNGKGRAFIFEEFCEKYVAASRKAVISKMGKIAGRGREAFRRGPECPDVLAALHCAATPTVHARVLPANSKILSKV